ncbi:hypothetical protein LINPERHAP1_LOCUS39478, partial [Linum perenne]
GGSTFPGGPVEEELKLPRPFTGIVGNLPSGWGHMEAYEQEKILEWLHMARRVIDDEISIVKESMELKMEEDKATQAETQDHGGNDNSTDLDANKVNVNSTTPPNDQCTHVPSKMDQK